MSEKPMGASAKRSGEHAKGAVKNASSKAKNVADEAGNADSDTAKRAGETVQQSTAYRAFVTVGLLAYGFVHLVVAYIALNIAWGGGESDEEASTSGALQKVAEVPLGFVILWVCAVGLAALVLWQLIEAAIGYTHLDGAKRLSKRLSSAGRAIVYAVLAFSAVQATLGSGGGGDSQKSLVATVLGWPLGQIIVTLVGLGVIAAGGFQIYKGVTKKFKEDLDGGVGRIAINTGRIGYMAKGFSIAIVGVLFVWSAFSHNPDEAGSTDSALRTLVDQPFGPYLLSLVALGLVAFAIFCFFWAFNARHEKDNG